MQELKSICFIGLLIAIIASADGAFGAEPATRKTNFVVVLADDLGYGDLACYGHPVIQTPHLDRFAAEGVKFTRCYSSAPNCSPSRTGLMTGRTPYRVGVHNWIPMLSPMHVRESEVTVATLLRNAGYATCHAGKWHLNGRFNLPGQPQPSGHGFDHWFATQNNALPTHHNPENFVRNGKPVGQQKGYSSQLVVDEAIDWLKSGRDDSKPFFLFVCFHEPHEPIASDHRFTSLYSNEGPRSPYDPETSSLAAHHGNITQMDDAFGRLMRSLDKQGLRDDTFVFFTSDNGPAITRGHPHGSAGPLRNKKGSMYEGGIRVPGIMRWPGHTTAGQTCDEPICGFDVLPTLCQISGIPIPDDRAIDGTSFLPVFSNKPIRRRVPLYWQFNIAHGAPKVAMQQGDWKILATLTGPRIEPFGDIRPHDQENIHTAELDTFVLFNVSDDIGETTDVSQSEPERLKQMTAELQRLYREVRDESPTWPAWTWPRVEGQRIRQFRESLKKRR